MYEVFEHTADLGLRIRTESLNALFAEAGQGLFAVIVGDLDSIRTTTSREITLKGEEKEFLLLDWLSDLLYVFESERLLLRDFQVVVDESGLTAAAFGEPWDAGRHALEHEVKAVTYHGLKVEETSRGWLAEVIVDI
jgi:SHS2 domain-containing protein